LKAFIALAAPQFDQQEGLKLLGFFFAFVKEMNEDLFVEP